MLIQTDLFKGAQAFEFIDQAANHPKPLLPEIGPGNIYSQIPQEIIRTGGTSPLQEADQTGQEGWTLFPVFFKESQGNEFPEDVAVAVET